jgi:hypothetical protein
MITNWSILKNLIRIDRLYCAAHSPIESLLYAKLGIIELCGWTEEAMDSIVLEVSRRRLTTRAHREYVENDIVKKTYGFEYETHFRKMLMSVIGLEGVQDMEANVNRAFFDPMCGSLKAMKPSRNSHSHTYLKATMTIDAPSVTIKHCRTIYSGLKDIDSVLQRRDLAQAKPAGYGLARIP